MENQMNKLIKSMLKNFIPRSLLMNLKGVSGVIKSTYYADYLFNSGKIRALKEVCIEVTFRCNCRCLMCPLYGVQTNGSHELLENVKENKELDLAEFTALFRGLKELGTQYINFTGGEAFLRPDILDIAAMAKKAGIKVSFTTNGGLITPEIAKGLVELGIDVITFSLDGPKEIHDKIRKAKVFDRIMEAVDWITAEKIKRKSAVPSLSFLCTVSALNQNYLKELVPIAKKNNVSLTIDPIIFATQETWDNTKKYFREGFIKKENFVMPDEIGKIDIYALEKELDAVFALAKEIKQPVYVSIEGRKTRKRFFNDTEYSVVNKCLMPWYFCRVDPYGNVYPCSLSISMGNLRERGIKEIINGDNAVNFRKNLKEKRLFPFCKKCCVLYSHNAFWNLLPKL